MEANKHLLMQLCSIHEQWNEFKPFFLNCYNVKHFTHVCEGVCVYVYNKKQGTIVPLSIYDIRHFNDLLYHELTRTLMWHIRGRSHLRWGDYESDKRKADKITSGQVYEYGAGEGNNRKNIRTTWTSPSDPGKERYTYYIIILYVHISVSHLQHNDIVSSM